MSVSACDMSDAAVLKIRINKWDYQLLKTHDIQMADFDKARNAYHTLSKATKAETRAAREAEFLAEKRLILAKLQELRAGAGQAMKKDLRIASAPILAAKDGAEKARVAMLNLQMRTHKRMLKILGEQAEHLEDIGEVGKVMGAAEDCGDADFAPATDDEQIGSDGEERMFVVTDGYEQPGADADTEPPASGAGSSTDHLRPAAKAAAAKAPKAKAPKAKAPAAPEAEVTACPACNTPVKGKRGLASHKRRCPGPGEERLLLGAPGFGCAYFWVRLALGAPTFGCVWRWVRLLLGTPGLGCAYFWVRLALAAPTFGCARFGKRLALGAPAFGCAWLWVHRLLGALGFGCTGFWCA